MACFLSSDLRYMIDPAAMDNQENANLHVKPPIMEMIIVGDVAREQLPPDANMTLEQTVQMCQESELASKRLKENENPVHNDLTTTKITNNESSKLPQILKQGQIDDKNPASNSESSTTLLVFNDDCLLNMCQYLDRWISQ